MANYRIRTAEASDLEMAGRLFTFYPYKTTQQARQRINRERLDEFFRAGLAKGLATGKPYWVAQEGGELIALGGLSESPGHSRVYGMKMGRIEPWINSLHPEAGEALLAAVQGAAAQRGLRHLSTRVDGEDFVNLHLFENDGWRTIDVSMKFSLAMPLKRRRMRRGGTPTTLSIEIAKPEDAEWIRRIGSGTHGATHFLNDPALAVEKTRTLFADWLDRCLETLAYRIYTLKDPQGRGLGFVTFLQNEAFAEAVGRRPLVLDYVILDPAVRGRSLGPWLIEQTLLLEAESGFDYCELRTSLHNLAAVACYEKLGFECSASDFVLHKSLEGVAK